MHTNPLKERASIQPYSVAGGNNLWAERVKQYKTLYAHKMQQVGQYTVASSIYIYTALWVSVCLVVCVCSFICMHFRDDESIAKYVKQIDNGRQTKEWTCFCVYFSHFWCVLIFRSAELGDVLFVRMNEIYLSIDEDATDICHSFGTKIDQTAKDNLRFLWIIVFDLIWFLWAFREKNMVTDVVIAPGDARNSKIFTLKWFI